MLVEFSIKNWACFRDTQSFQMTTQARSADDDFTFDSGHKRAGRLNRVSAFYGANASGKSRLIQALNFMRSFVERSSNRKINAPIPVEPFLFDAPGENQPSEFQIVFLQDRTLYRYGFSLTRDHVRQEWLHAVPRDGRTRLLFERDFDPEDKKTHVKWGPSVSGHKQLWVDSTRPNALLVSTAAQLNSNMLQPVVDWFEKLHLVKGGEISPIFSTRQIKEVTGFKDKAIDFLQAADLHIDNVKIVEEKMPEELRKMLQIREENEKDEEKNIPDTVLSVKMGHKKRGRKTLAWLDIGKESEGTQALFALAGPCIHTIENNQVLVVDELDNSLHPKLLKFLVGQINTSEHNSKAQLIFTTHDTTQMDEVLDKEQIWFIEKDKHQASAITPYLAYRPRDDNATAKRYLSGRYGAVPNLGHLKSLDRQAS